MTDVRIHQTPPHPSKPNFNVSSSNKPTWLCPLKALALLLASPNPGTLLWSHPTPRGCGVGGLSGEQCSGLLPVARTDSRLEGCVCDADSSGCHREIYWQAARGRGTRAGTRQAAVLPAEAGKSPGLAETGAVWGPRPGRADTEF